MNLRIYPCFFALYLLLSLSGCASTFSEPVVSGSDIPASPASESSVSNDTDTTDIPDTPVATGLVSEKGYVLGQGDVIGIQVFDEPDLTLDAAVSASGIINYSYLGDVRVAGKTPRELEQHISALLKEGYLVNPSVNVSVKQFRPFFIGGEVRSPGSYPFQPGLTLDKAIALAGGLTDRASTRRMFVVRAGGDVGNPQRISFGDVVSPGDTLTIREGFF